MVGRSGFEPLTSRLSAVCSNQLSYRPAGKILHRTGKNVTTLKKSPPSVDEAGFDDPVEAEVALIQISSLPGLEVDVASRVVSLSQVRPS